MEYLSKVCLDKRIRRSYTIKISIVGTISLLGLILGIYSLTAAKYVFAVWYFIALFLGLSYVIIRINTAFPSYIATDGEKMMLSVWKNRVMPYTLPEKPNFISDFIPDKVITEEFPVSEIDSILIGSKKFLKRALAEDDYPSILKRLDNDRHFDSTTKRMDFIYFRLRDNSYQFMSVTNFDVHELSGLIDIIEKNCVGVQIHTNIPKLFKIRNKITKQA